MGATQKFFQFFAKEFSMKECRGGKEMPHDLDRAQVIADATTPPKRIIDAADGCSADEIAASHEFMSD